MMWSGCCLFKRVCMFTFPETTLEKLGGNLELWSCRVWEDAEHLTSDQFYAAFGFVKFGSTWFDILVGCVMTDLEAQRSKLFKAECGRSVQPQINPASASIVSKSTHNCDCNLLSGHTRRMLCFPSGFAYV